ncbi:MAG: crossover junction endodeoxyribonuclease RuvC [Elusimicrobia bacterium]|nr:crossover junction endodeoxyribonuclease RuvC [Elusimicrobiota bacterium]
MKIFGIDPGLDRTGWAVVEKTGSGPLKLAASGLIHTEKGKNLGKRLLEIFDAITAEMRRSAPDEISIEEAFFSKRADTQANTTHARGVILLACEKMGLRINAYNPKTIKANLSGNGNADKRQMQRIVQLLLNLKEIPKPDDVADAMAAAVCHIRLGPFRAAMAKAGSKMRVRMKDEG